MPPPPANAKAAYATMVYVRATIVEDAGWVLARATTIAVRHLFPTCVLTSNPPKASDRLHDHAAHACPQSTE